MAERAFRYGIGVSTGTSLAMNQKQDSVAPSKELVKTSHRVLIYMAPQDYEKLMAPVPCSDTASVLQTAIRMATGQESIHHTVFMFSDMCISPRKHPLTNEWVLYLSSKVPPMMGLYSDDNLFLEIIGKAILLPVA